MARIFRPSRTESPPSPFDSPVVMKFVQFELLAGAFCLVAGGFVLRARDTYSLIVIGLSLLGLGSFRLWQRARIKNRDGSIPLEDDRLLRSLRLKLNANYSIVLNYPLSDEDSIPYMVLGPTGVFVMDTWSKKGEVLESESGRKWIVEGSDEGETETVRNPVVENERRIQKLRDSVDKPGLLKPLHNCVVLLGRRADCDVLRDENVIEINDLMSVMRSDEAEDVLDWEDVDDLERLLDLKDSN